MGTADFRLCRRVEGRVAEPYRPGERRWLKVKNRAYWRYPHEVEAVRRRVASSL